MQVMVYMDWQPCSKMAIGMPLYWTSTSSIRSFSSSSHSHVIIQSASFSLHILNFKIRCTMRVQVKSSDAKPSKRYVCQKWDKDVEWMPFAHSTHQSNHFASKMTKYHSQPHQKYWLAGKNPLKSTSIWQQVLLLSIIFNFLYTLWNRLKIA